MTSLNCKPGDVSVTKMLLTSARGWQLDLITGAVSQGGGSFTDTRLATFVDFSIYESIFQPFVTAEIDVYDVGDALGTLKITGDETIQITYSVPGINPVIDITLSLTELANITNLGSLKAKSYQLRATSTEMLYAQQRYVTDNFNELTSDIVKKVVTNSFNLAVTKKTITVLVPTAVSQKINANNENPIVFLDRLKERHVASTGNTHLYVLFEQRGSGGWGYNFTTFDQLLTQPPGTGYVFTVDPGLMSADITQRNEYVKAIYLQLPRSFYTPTQFSGGKVNVVTYNTATGVSSNNVISYNPNNFNFSGTSTDSPVSNEQVTNINTTQTPPPIYVPIDPVNQQSATQIANAAAQRSQFMTRLQNDMGMIEVYANPDLRLGDVMTLSIPKSSANASPGDTEQMVNQGVLIVSLRHKVGLSTHNPRATYVIGFVKAGYCTDPDKPAFPSIGLFGSALQSLSTTYNAGSL